MSPGYSDDVAYIHHVGFGSFARDAAPGVLEILRRRRMTSFRRVGKLYRRREEVHRLRLYESDELAGELRRTGFTVRILRGYGELRFRNAHVGFVARNAP